MNIMISENLKALRKQKGKKQEDLAEFLSVSINAVSKWERGECYPDIDLLPKIALYYDIGIDDLLIGKTKSLRQIKESVSDVAKSSNETAASIKETSATINEVSAMMKRLAENTRLAAQFDLDIMEKIKQRNILHEEINAASQELANGLHQINIAIAQIEKSTVFNAAITSDLAAAIQELKEQE